MGNTKLIEQTRDRIEEKAEALTPKAARKLFETPFEHVLEDIAPEAREELFLTAKEEVDALTRGEATHWNAVYNTYVQLMELVTLIRNDKGSREESTLSDLAQEVFHASNRISTLFYILRKNKDLTEAQGRNIIEAAFPTALGGLSDDAKQAVFSYVYERNSGTGWGNVADEYIKLVELVSQVKRDGLLAPVEGE